MAWDKIRPLFPGEEVTKQSDDRLQLPDIAMVGYHQIGGSEPYGPAGLRRHSEADISFFHATLQSPTHSGPIVGIHNDAWPAHRGLEQRHLDYHHTGKPLQISLDSTEDQGMSDRFQSPELPRVAENDPGQRLAVYLAFEDDVRPPVGDRGQGFVGQDGMTHRVRVDGANAPLRQ